MRRLVVGLALAAAALTFTTVAATAPTNDDELLKDEKHFLEQSNKTYTGGNKGGSALNMIAVGEETGKLEGMLGEVAGFYDQEVKRTTKRLTSLLEPILILGMGLVIGVVVISMLLAIFSINDLPF